MGGPFFPSGLILLAFTLPFPVVHISLSRFDHHVIQDSAAALDPRLFCFREQEACEASSPAGRECSQGRAAGPRQSTGRHPFGWPRSAPVFPRQKQPAPDNRRAGPGTRGAPGGVPELPAIAPSERKLHSAESSRAAPNQEPILCMTFSQEPRRSRRLIEASFPGLLPSLMMCQDQPAPTCPPTYF